MNQGNAKSYAFVSRSGWYSFCYPKDWTVDESGDSTAVFDPEHGVGALHISAYRTPVPADSKSELIEHLSDNVPPVDEERVSSFSLGSKNVASFEYTNDGDFHKIWFIGDGCYLILANYVSNKEDARFELPKVEEIIASIEVEPSLSKN